MISLISSANFLEAESFCLDNSEEVNNCNYQSDSSKKEKYGWWAQTLIYDGQNNQAEGAAQPVESGRKGDHFGGYDFRNIHPDHWPNCGTVQSHINHKDCKNHPKDCIKSTDVYEQYSQYNITNP